MSERNQGMMSLSATVTEKTVRQNVCTLMLAGKICGGNPTAAAENASRWRQMKGASPWGAAA